MTVQELYGQIGGSYDDVRRILPMDNLIAKFVVKFLDDKSAETLFSAWEARDPAALFEGAHAMKGVCANIGLTSLSASASALAEAFRPGKERTMDDAEVQSRVDALRADYDRAVEGIRAFAAQQ